MIKSIQQFQAEGGKFRKSFRKLFRRYEEDCRDGLRDNVLDLEPSLIAEELEMYEFLGVVFKTGKIYFSPS